MPTSGNPIDDSSTRLKDVNSEKDKKCGPRFLWKSESESPTHVFVDVNGSAPQKKATFIVSLAFFKAGSKVFKLAKVEKSNDNNSTDKANLADAN